jgi:F0F1-type ATP synthase assembly protein I
MNESVLYTLAEVAVSLAGFSGLVVVFRLRGTEAWTPTELRIFWLLLGDSFLVLIFALLPFPFALANWSPDAIWGLCNALLGSCLIMVDLWVLQGERRDRAAKQLVTVPVITPLLYILSGVAFVVGLALWLSVWDFVVQRGQAVYVLGLILMIAFAAMEFLFFIGLTLRQRDDFK